MDWTLAALVCSLVAVIASGIAHARSVHALSDANAALRQAAQIKSDAEAGARAWSALQYSWSDMPRAFDSYVTARVEERIVDALRRQNEVPPPMRCVIVADETKSGKKP